MKKITSISVIALTLFTVFYFSNSAFAGKAAVPSGLSPASQTVPLNRNIEFKVNNFGLQDITVTVKVIPSSGGNYSSPVHTEIMTTEGVSQFEPASTLGSGSYLWKAFNSDGASSEERTITVQ